MGYVAEWCVRLGGILRGAVNCCGKLRVGAIAMLIPFVIAVSGPASAQDPWLNTFSIHDSAQKSDVSRREAYFNSVFCSPANNPEQGNPPIFCVNIYNNKVSYTERSKVGVVSRATWDKAGIRLVLDGAPGNDEPLPPLEVPVYLSDIGDDQYQDRVEFFRIGSCDPKSPSPALTFHGNSEDKVYGGEEIFDYLRECRKNPLSEGLVFSRRFAEDSSGRRESDEAFRGMAQPIMELDESHVEIVAYREARNAADPAILIFLGKDRTRNCDTQLSGIPKKFLDASRYCRAHIGDPDIQEEQPAHDDTGGPQEESSAPAVGVIAHIDGKALPVKNGSWSMNLVVGPNGRACVYSLSGGPDDTTFSLVKNSPETDSLSFGELGRVAVCVKEPVNVYTRRGDDVVMDRSVELRFSLRGGDYVGPGELINVLGLVGADVAGVFWPVETVNIYNNGIFLSEQRVSLAEQRVDAPRKHVLVIELPETEVALGDVKVIGMTEQDTEALGEWCALDAEPLMDEPRKMTIFADEKTGEYRIFDIVDGGASETPTDLKFSALAADTRVLRVKARNPDACDYTHDVTFAELQNGVIQLDALPSRPYNTLAVYFVTRRTLAEELGFNQAMGEDLANALINIVNRLARDGAKHWDEVSVKLMRASVPGDLAQGQTGQNVLGLTREELLDLLMDVNNNSQLKNEVRALETENVFGQHTTVVMIGFGTDGPNLCGESIKTSLAQLRGATWGHQRAVLYLLNVNPQTTQAGAKLMNCGSIMGLENFQVFEGPIFALTSAQAVVSNEDSIIRTIMESAGH